MAAAEGDDADVFGYHYENGMLAVNLFHMRGGKVVDRREFFWEDLGETAGSADSSRASSSRALLKQLYLDQHYVPRTIYVPVEFEDRAALEELLTKARSARVHIHVPQRGDKRSLVDLVGHNAKQSYDQRFRVMKPTPRRSRKRLQDALTLPELPKRIECFDISHIQGAETVASMVVWEDGAMKKSDYRKFIIKRVAGVDDFASMREVVTRRYKRAAGRRKQPMPSLILIDGGLGQLHAAAEALEVAGHHHAAAGLDRQARRNHLRATARRTSPSCSTVTRRCCTWSSMIRDEAHRFAVTFHRKRREMRDRDTELLDIPGVGERTTQPPAAALRQPASGEGG